MPKLKTTVVLNGTDKNPFAILNLTQNPFPHQMQPAHRGDPVALEIAAEASSEHQIAILHLQRLAAEPIKSAEQIRQHLAGWPSDFVELCCAQFVPGKRVEFTVEFPV